MDSFDQHILTLLQRDASISLKDLAEAVNLSTTHLQRFLSARRRELDALEGFRASVEPLTEASATPTPLPLVRRADEQSA